MEISKDDLNNQNLKTNLNFISNYSKKEYFNIVEKSKSYICQGDIFQVVPSQRFVSKYLLNSISLYRSLILLSSSPVDKFFCSIIIQPLFLSMLLAFRYWWFSAAYG